MKPQYQKIKFKAKKNFNDRNEFIVWLVVLVLSTIGFYSVTNPILKWIFLASIVVLLLFAVNETVKKLRNLKSHSTLKETTPYLNRIRLKINTIYVMWLIGVSLVIFGLLLLFIVREIQLNDSLIEILRISVIPAFFIGFCLFFFGKLGRASREQGDNTYLQVIEVLGIFIIIAAIYFYAYSLFYSNNDIIFVLFYGSLLFGLSFISVGEIFEKKRYNYILSLSLLAIVLFIAILDFVFTPDEFFFFREYNYYQNQSFKDLTILGFLDIVETVSLVSFLLLGCFYLINYEKLKQKEYEKEREIIKDLTQASFSILIICVTLIIVFSFYV